MELGKIVNYRNIKWILLNLLIPIIPIIINYIAQIGATKEYQFSKAIPEIFFLCATLAMINISDIIEYVVGWFAEDGGRSISFIFKKKNDYKFTNAFYWLGLILFTFCLLLVLSLIFYGMMIVININEELEKSNITINPKKNINKYNFSIIFSYFVIIFAIFSLYLSIMALRFMNNFDYPLTIKKKDAKKNV